MSFAERPLAEPLIEGDLDAIFAMVADAGESRCGQGSSDRHPEQPQEVQAAAEAQSASMTVSLPATPVATVKSPATDTVIVAARPVVRELVDALSRRTDGGHKSLTLTIEDRQLGAVVVRAFLNDGRVELSLEVKTEAARCSLERELPEARSLLSARGVTLGRTSFSLTKKRKPLMRHGEKR